MTSQPLSLDTFVNSLRISVIQNNNNNKAISQERTIFFYICDNEQVYIKQAYKSTLCFTQWKLLVKECFQIYCEKFSLLGKAAKVLLLCATKTKTELLKARGPANIVFLAYQHVTYSFSSAIGQRSVLSLVVAPSYVWQLSHGDLW